jgi:hypothetical protein
MKKPILFHFVFLLNIGLSQESSWQFESTNQGLNVEEVDTSILSYFNEITSGTEFSTSKGQMKFVEDIYFILQGNFDEELKKEAEKIVCELNDLINPIHFYLTDDIEKANVRIYFGGPDDYVKINPMSESFIENSWGLFFLFPKYHNIIDMSLVFIDVVRSENNTQRKHVLREEMTQCLGFGNDSFLYPESIFYQGWTETLEYSEMDKEIIKMLYNENVALK